MYVVKNRSNFEHWYRNPTPIQNSPTVSAPNINRYIAANIYNRQKLIIISITTKA